LDTCQGDLAEKEDERTDVCLRRPQGGEKNRRGRRQKEDRKGHETIVVVFFDTYLAVWLLDVVVLN
jgi:hypothetical protein